eukprot:Polyplicarium_translucidae@DN1931_c0_g1_i1.p1
MALRASRRAASESIRAATWSRIVIPRSSNVVLECRVSDSIRPFLVSGMLTASDMTWLSATGGRGVGRIVSLCAPSEAAYRTMAGFKGVPIESLPLVLQEATPRSLTTTIHALEGIVDAEGPPLLVSCNRGVRAAAAAWVVTNGTSMHRLWRHPLFRTACDDLNASLTAAGHPHAAETVYAARVMAVLAHNLGSR